METRKRINKSSIEKSCTGCKSVNERVKKDKGPISKTNTIKKETRPRVLKNNLSDAEKYRINRERNNAYSKKSREKRQAYVNRKQRDEMELEEKNCTLLYDHEKLRKEVDLLKQKINIILRNCENCNKQISIQKLGNSVKE